MANAAKKFLKREVEQNEKNKNNPRAHRALNGFDSYHLWFIRFYAINEI